MIHVSVSLQATGGGLPRASICCLSGAIKVIVTQLHSGAGRCKASFP